MLKEEEGTKGEEGNENQNENQNENMLQQHEPNTKDE
jgi:hypothetical protein